jgi:predicted DNA-binding transcriptional regulator AlpA
MDTINPPSVTKGAFTIDEFCDAHDLSRATFYNLRKVGRGPREMKVGARRLISIEAAADWRRQMEEKTEAA